MRLSISLSIHLSVYIYFRVYLHIFLYASMCLSRYPSIYMYASIFLYIYQCIYLSVYPSIYIYVSVYLPLHLSTYVHLCVNKCMDLLLSLCIYVSISLCMTMAQAPGWTGFCPSWWASSSRIISPAARESGFTPPAHICTASSRHVYTSSCYQRCSRSLYLSLASLKRDLPNLVSLSLAFILSRCKVHICYIYQLLIHQLSTTLS